MVSKKLKLETEIAALQGAFYLVKAIGAFGTFALGVCAGGFTHSIIVFLIVWFGSVWLFMDKIYEPFRQSRLEALRSRYSSDDSSSN